jgi:hypothetical protein
MSNVENMRHEKTIVFEYYDPGLREKRYNGTRYGHEQDQPGKRHDPEMSPVHYTSYGSSG